MRGRAGEVFFLVAQGRGAATWKVSRPRGPIRIEAIGQRGEGDEDVG